MPVGEHGQLTTSEGIHIVYQWSYADAAARTGATGFVAADVGKLARQLDDNSLWMLTATSPTWVQVGGPPATIDHGGLTGLGDDDHTQYLLLTGARAGATAGPQDFGANGILADNLADSSGGGIAAADDMTLAQGKTVNLQGASGGPQSGTARDVLAKIGHILDGGHPVNPYPATRNADDAEFNNAVQAENNTIGTHAGGDFWEWSPGAPADVRINNAIAPSYLYVGKFIGDSGTDRYLIGDITPPASGETYGAQLVLINDGLIFTSDMYVGLRLNDSVSGNFLRIRLNVTSGTISVIASYDAGSGETTLATFSSITPDFNILSLELDRIIVSSLVYHRSFLSFAKQATTESTRLTVNSTTLAPGDLIPDEVWLEFSNSGAAFQQIKIDSYRRVI